MACAVFTPLRWWRYTNRKVKILCGGEWLNKIERGESGSGESGSVSEELIRIYGLTQKFN